VDLRPVQTLAVNISAAVNKSTGLLTWTYSSIDPTTGQPPADPEVGFLPPDTDPPNGEGYLTYNVKPLAGIANGTVLSNQATVVFDFNAPINTKVWSDTVFNPPPGGTAAALPDALAFGPAKTSSKRILGKVLIKNEGKTTLSGVVGTPSSPFTLVSGRSGNGTFTLSPGKGLALKIGMPTAQAGDFAGNLVLLTSDPANSQISVSLTGAVYVPGSLNIATKNIYFGSVPVGHSTSRPVTVINHNSAPVAIYNVDIADSKGGAFVSDKGCVGTLAAGASCTENVTFTPEKTRRAEATLLFADDTKGSPQKVSLSGSGK
jgi:hypothetical protein